MEKNSITDVMSIAAEKARQQQNMYYKFGFNNDPQTKYTVLNDGNIFTAETKYYNVTMENGRISRYEEFDEYGNRTKVLSSRQNYDGSIDLFYDKENDGRIDGHIHNNYDSLTGLKVSCTDENNNNHYESITYTKYGDDSREYEILTEYNDKNGQIEYERKTDFYPNGHTVMQEHSKYYDNNENVKHTSFRKFDKNGQVTEYGENDKVYTRRYIPEGFIDDCSGGFYFGIINGQIVHGEQ